MIKIVIDLITIREMILWRNGTLVFGCKASFNAMLIPGWTPWETRNNWALPFTTLRKMLGFIEGTVFCMCFAQSSYFLLFIYLLLQSLLNQGCTSSFRLCCKISPFDFSSLPGSLQGYLGFGPGDYRCAKVNRSLKFKLSSWPPRSMLLSVANR